MSRALGVAGQTDHPKLVATIDRVAAAVRKERRHAAGAADEQRGVPAQCGAVTRPRVGYAMRASPETRLLRILQTQIDEARKLIA